MILETPPSFSFVRAVFSHGWFDLPPFRWDNAERTLHRVLTISGGRSRVVSIRPGAPSVRAGTPGSLDVTLQGPGAVSRKSGAVTDQAEVIRQVRHMLRLDEPFIDFHTVCRDVDDFSWVGEAKAGPLLRAPHPFEDLVKMICTTNCTWALTRMMVGGLVRHLGTPAAGSKEAGEARSFPSAEAMADAPLRFYVKEMKAGYRARYLRDLSRRVASGDLDPRRWLDPAVATEEIRKEILSVQGAGRYVADNVLKLLGRYDGLGIDSWCRRKFGEMHRRGRPARNDRAIERFYAPFGKWRGLALWCDLTRDWFKDGVPVALARNAGTSGQGDAKY